MRRERCCRHPPIPASSQAGHLLATDCLKASSEAKRYREKGTARRWLFRLHGKSHPFIRHLESKHYPYVPHDADPAFQPCADLFRKPSAQDQPLKTPGKSTPAPLETELRPRGVTEGLSFRDGALQQGKGIVGRQLSSEKPIRFPPLEITPNKLQMKNLPRQGKSEIQPSRGTPS